jgi:hypothetical protein
MEGDPDSLTVMQAKHAAVDRNLRIKAKATAAKSRPKSKGRAKAKGTPKSVEPPLVVSAQVDPTLASDPNGEAADADHNYCSYHMMYFMQVCGSSLAPCGSDSDGHTRLPLSPSAFESDLHTGWFLVPAH